MSKKARGCLIVFVGFFALLVVAGIIANVSSARADDEAKAVCAAIPVGSTLVSARAIARRQQAKEIPYPEGTYRFVFHGGMFHQAECALQVSGGVVTKKGLQVDDY